MLIVLCAVAAPLRPTVAAESPLASPMDSDSATRAFVQIAGPRAIVHCGNLELHLDPARGFSLAAAHKTAGSGGLFLKSSEVSLEIDGKRQPVNAVGHIANLAIVEEGPQRIVLRAPFSLTDPSSGQRLANAQYELTCYGEGELFVTLRILPLVQKQVRSSLELRLDGAAMRFERSYDLPLLGGTSDDGLAAGLYWHDGDEPEIGVVGNDLLCALSIGDDSAPNERVLARSFVVSLARDRSQLRHRCVAHIQPLRPRAMQSCQPMIEQTAQSRQIARELSGWCYNFRDGTYNLQVEGPRATVEFYNPYDEPRQIRLRFVARGQPSVDLAAFEHSEPPPLQIVTLSPDAQPGEPNHVSATLASFALPARECLTVEANRVPRLLLQWVAARQSQGGITRHYRIAQGDPPASLAEIRIREHPDGGAFELSLLTPPAPGKTATVATLAAFPQPIEGWQPLTNIDDISITRNRPDRVVLQVEASNAQRTFSCRSALVFHREGPAMALTGYCSLEALESARSLRPTLLNLTSFEISESTGTVSPRPQTFFYADRNGAIQVAAASSSAGFGYDVRGFDRSVNRQYSLCGFAEGTPWTLAYFARCLTLSGGLSIGQPATRLSLRAELPPTISRGQRFEAFWKLLLAQQLKFDPAALQSQLQSLKSTPVDLTWTDGRLKVSDGRIAHRVFELSPSGNPGSPDGWCYLIDGGSELAVVGAGADSLRWPWLFRIRALGLDPGRLGKILLTNCRRDHAGGARQLRRLTGAAVHVHESAVEALSVAGPEQDQRMGTVGDTGRFDPVTVDQPLRDGQVITIGNLQAIFSHTPGPSGESGVYVLRPGGVSMAFVGDLLTAGDTASTPVGNRADAHAHGNLAEWMASLKRLQDARADLALPSCSAPIAGMQQITAACDLGIERCRKILLTENIDRQLPRPLVLLPPEAPKDVPPKDALLAVKEVPRPAQWRTAPLEIAPGLWRVGGNFAGEWEDANVYLLDGGGEMALIGAGSGLHTDAILRRILSLGKNPLEIKYILLPSCHWYEARGAESWRAATGAFVCAHPYEAGALWRGDVVRTGLRIGRYSFGAFPPCRVDRELVWGETLRVGDRHVIVLDAPGFHRGSTAFLMIIDRKRYLATGQAAWGDLPTPDGGLHQGAMGWIDPHWGGCTASWGKTIERFIALRPDALLTGQGYVEMDQIDRQLNECLTRLEEFEALPPARALLPPETFDERATPNRPDISRLAVAKP